MTKKTKRRLAKKTSRSPSTTNKYKSAKYVEYIFTAEVGILNADVLLPDLNDGQVATALKKLVARINKEKGLPHYKEEPADAEGMIAWLIVENWNHLFSQRRQLSKKDMIGCLETIIESVETRMRRPTQRKYLTYLTKFMKRAGVSAEAISASELEEDERYDETVFDLENMSLAEVGQLWLKQPDIPEIDDAFENKASHQIAAGQSEMVAALCNKLLKQTREPYIQAIFYTVQGQAYRHQGKTEQAIAVLSTARAKNESYLGSRHELAEIYYKQAQYELAIEALQECLVGNIYDATIYQDIAQNYRQMGDLASEETAWRNLLKVRQRRGCAGFLARVRRRHQNSATLYRLADCLQRQGKRDEAAKVARPLAHSAPHSLDPFEDWLYWIRYRLEHREEAEKMLRPLQNVQRRPRRSPWSKLLQACVYDWLEQPWQSAPLWQDIKQQRLDVASRNWSLALTNEVIGYLLPSSSQLFELLRQIDLEIKNEREKPLT